MSTKSTVLYSDNTGNHVYEETNEPVYLFGKFQGFNIHGVIEFDELKGIKIQNGGLLMYFIKDTFFGFLFPEGFLLRGADLIDFEMDKDGASFEIKAGSITYDHLMEAKKRADSIPKSGFVDSSFLSMDLGPVDIDEK